MPKLSSAAPAFAVADVGETIRWYQAQLGFTAYPFPETPPYVFAIVSRDRGEIMFQGLSDYQKPDLYPLRPGGLKPPATAGCSDFFCGKVIRPERLFPPERVA